MPIQFPVKLQFSECSSFLYVDKFDAVFRCLSFLECPDYAVSTSGILLSKRWHVKWKKTDDWTKRKGHRQTTLVGSDGIDRPFTIPEIILTSFVGPRPSGLECCHNDGDETNNNLENLRWDTHQANMDDKKKHGTVTKGEDHPLSKLKTKDVIEIWDMWETGKYSYRFLADRFGISTGTIEGILAGKTWAEHARVRPKINGKTIKRRTESSTGTNNPSAKLTDAQVISLRERYQSGIFNMREEAKNLGIGENYLSLVVRGKRWKHLQNRKVP